MGKYFCSNIKKFRFSYITVEPLVFFFTFGMFLSFPTNTALMYKKSCLIDFNLTFCDDMDNKTYQDEHPSEQDTVQKVASYWVMLNQIALAIPCTLVVFLFMASWGDMFDRKIPLILPVIGGIVCNVINLLSAFYMEWHVGILVVGSAVNSCLGTYTAFLMGVFTYIVKVSDSHQKTIRVGIVESMSFLSGGVSVFVSGLIRKGVDFTGVYVVVLAFQVVSLMYCIFCIKSVKPVKADNTTDEGCTRKCGLGAVIDMIGFLKKKREGNMTLYLWIYILLVNLMYLGTAGEFDILYLFLRRAPRSFNGVEYGYFKGAENFTRSLTLIVLLPVLKGVFKLRDTTIFMIGATFKGIQFLILGLAKSLTVAFIALIFATLQGFPSAAARSAMSKLVEEEEYGRMFGMVAVTEGLIALAASFLFNGLYPETLDVFDGIMFECIAGISVITIFMALYLHVKKADLIDVRTTDHKSIEEPQTHPVEKTKL